MNRPHNSSLAIALLLTGAIILPIAISLVLGAASLLSTMGDTVGGGVLKWIALSCGIIWVLNLILLVLALAINTLNNPNDSDSEEK
jgi:hypothetical protein